MSLFGQFMNPANPIIPPESPLHRSRASAGPKLYMSVFAILTIHAFLLAELLIQGCKREDRATGPQDTAINAAWNLPVQTPSPPAQPQPPVVTAPVPAGTVAPGQTNLALTPPPATATPRSQAAGKTVASQDQVSALPKAALPSVEGDKPTSVYVVKAGDTLTAIAKAHGSTVKAIRAANNLKTDRLLVGKKLKIPTASQTLESKPTPAAASTNVPPLVLPQ
jgi:LysM repeat protein